MHQTTLAHIADILKDKKQDFYLTDKEHKTKLSKLPDFPAEIKPSAESVGKALDALRKRDDVMWTCISPAANFQPDGLKTGKYKDIGKECTLNSKGKSDKLRRLCLAFLD